MYSAREYAIARQTLNDRRQQAYLEAEKRRADIYTKLPRLREIEGLFAQTGRQIAQCLFAGEEAPRLIEKLRRENEGLQAEQKALLQGIGLTVEDLEPRFHCLRCKDTGYVTQETCGCFLQLLKKEASGRLPNTAHTGQYGFEQFSLDYYSDQKTTGPASPADIMQKVLKRCRTYAEAFAPQTSESLLFVGGTGLGKTHLSLAIAGTVMEKGYFALYDSAQNIVDRAGRERFGRDDSGEDAQFMEQALGCDLLVIDDLGSEFQSQLAAAVVFHLVNTRLTRRLPTIVSTNLSLKEIETRYSERLVSRLTCAYQMVMFAGEDVRMQKRTRQINQR